MIRSEPDQIPAIERRIGNFVLGNARRLRELRSNLEWIQPMLEP